ncbi:MAG: redoxin domain-containing protein [Ardenticatenales bacterium]|nr:redoxin domain-containing protein [Ardenticatenales bacterium]
MVRVQAPFTPPDQPLGFEEPLVDFELATLDGQLYPVREHLKDVLVICFWSAECPVVKKYDPYFNGFAKSYGAKGVTFLGIDSNVYDDEDDIWRAIEERHIAFPILRDQGNVIADYFGAVTTPHIYIFDRTGRLRYRGGVDDTSFKQKEATVNYLEEAVDALLLGNEAHRRESEPFGCTINRAWAE